MWCARTWRCPPSSGRTARGFGPPGGYTALAFSTPLEGTSLPVPHGAFQSSPVRFSAAAANLRLPQQGRHRQAPDQEDSPQGPVPTSGRWWRRTARRREPPAGPPGRSPRRGACALPPAGNLEALPGWTLLAVGLLLQAKQAADPVHRVRNRGQEAQPEQPVRDVGHSPPAARDDQGRAHRHEQQGQVQPEPPQRAGQGRQQGLQRTQVDVGAPRPAERPPRTRAVRRAGRSCSTATGPPRPPSS